MKVWMGRVKEKKNQYVKSNKIWESGLKNGIRKPDWKSEKK